MVKKGFSLFELIVSLVIISIAIASLSGLFVKDEKHKTYYMLQNIENDFHKTGNISNIENIKFQ